VVVGSWISLGKSGGYDYGREFSWNKTIKLRPDPARCVDSTNPHGQFGFDGSQKNHPKIYIFCVPTLSKTSSVKGDGYKPKPTCHMLQIFIVKIYFQRI
jgi:hypothetical protein